VSRRKKTFRQQFVVGGHRVVQGATVSSWSETTLESTELLQEKGKRRCSVKRKRQMPRAFSSGTGGIREGEYNKLGGG